ncbi:MAG: serine hydrolase, partial [Verrucomicrobia bacterium]|nr:serine hydrolase [Verrucomicrobiota bacterium]
MKIFHVTPLILSFIYLIINSFLTAQENVLKEGVVETKIEPTENESESEEVESEADPLETLIQDLEEIMKKEKVPGAGIAIVSKDKDIWVGGLGMADVEAGREADGDTLFRIGSISKMFVSLSMLKLQEEGRIDLQDTLLEHAPEIRFKNRWRETDPIKLVHLLEHTTGFDD